LNIDRIGPAPNCGLLLLVVSHAFSLPLYLPVAVHSGISAKKRAVDQSRQSFFGSG
jgi:hypothetical protein